MTDSLWSPIGINLTWTTSIPLPSLAAWPITALFGPIAALNFLTLLAPPLAAWSAFLLCRHLSKSWWPSLLGGYLFGFSECLLIENFLSHPQIALVFLVPLAALAAALAIEGKIGANRLIPALAAILAAQFLISTEMFATMTMFGAMALFLGWLVSPAIATARRIHTVALWILCAYVAAAVILSPYIYWLFAFGAPRGEVWPGSAVRFSANLLLFVLPYPASEVGQFPPFSTMWGRFLYAGTALNPSYIGLPSLAIAAVYARRQWRTALGKVLIGSFVVVSVLALGSRLHVGRWSGLELPGTPLMALPFIDKAFPIRFLIYGFLCLAIAVSIWFASNRIDSRVNAVIAAAVVLFTLPQLSLSVQTRSDSSPEFFRHGLYRHYLKADENVLVLPAAAPGDGMLWQAETEMYFRMAGGNTGLYPVEFDGWPIFQAFHRNVYLPDAAGQLGAFMADHKVDAAVVADNTPGAAFWEMLLPNFSAAKQEAGGVTIYRLLPAALTSYRGVTAAQMRRRAAMAAIDSLLLAGGRWLAAGRNLAQLTPFQALQHGGLKAAWCVGPSIHGRTAADLAIPDKAAHLFCGVALGGTPDGRNALVGIYGSYSDLKPAIVRYGKSARHIYFPYPHDLLAPGANPPAPDRRDFMELEFDSSQLEATAAQLQAPPHSPAP
ncbi:MAG: hypothetical protein ACREQI_12180 [Candidatus Binataceae bacterium]